MNAGEFDRMMTAMESTFGKKISADTRMLLWPICQDIPSSCASNMTERLCDLDKFPANIGRAIREAHRSSISAPSDFDAPKGCHLCDGPKRGGIITSAKPGIAGRYTIFATPCASCYPASPYRSTKQQIRAAGHEVCVSADRAEQSDWWKRIQRANTAHLFAGDDSRASAVLKSRARIARAATETQDERGFDTGYDFAS